MTKLQKLTKGQLPKSGMRFSVLGVVPRVTIADPLDSGLNQQAAYILA